MLQHNQPPANQNNSRKQSNCELPSEMPKPRRKTSNLVVEFDDKARREHLTGFSARKRARRIHGLAQQKRKEHQAIRQHRAEKRQAAKEAAEEEKVAQTSGIDSKKDEKVKECVVYQDAQTQNRWGGEVTVVATSEIPSEVEPTREKKKKAGEDTAQEYACSLERFVNEVKGKLPGKKSKKSKNQKAVTKKGGDAKSIAKRILKSRKKKR